MGIHQVEHKPNKQVTSATCNDQVLLQPAFVDVLDRLGRPIKCRALLDSGSQINLNTNSCRSKLGITLEESNAQFSVAGTAQVSSMGRSNVTLQVKDLQMKISATVVKGKLTVPLPAVKFERPFDLPNVKVADRNFNQPAEMDMIFVAQLYESLRTGKTIKHQGLHIVCTAFGYVISGVVKQCKTSQSIPIDHHVQQEDTLRRFWEIKKVSPPKKSSGPAKRPKLRNTTTAQQGDTTKVDLSLRCRSSNRHQVLANPISMH